MRIYGHFWFFISCLGWLIITYHVTTNLWPITQLYAILGGLGCFLTFIATVEDWTKWATK